MALSGGVEALKSIAAAPAWRVTLVMSALFATTGVTLVFLPRWLEVERGLSGLEIGAVLSLAQLARIATGPIIAFWADGLKDRNAALRYGAAAALCGYAAFFFAPSQFWILLLTGFVALSLSQALVPLVEGAVLRATSEGAMTYGVARGLGSIAFIVANVAGGALIARFGLGAVVAWTLTTLTLVLASAWRTRPDRALEAPRAARTGAVKSLIANRRFLVLIFACGLIQSSHAFYYGFSTLVWRGQGLAADFVGLLWAFGVAVEVAFLWSLFVIERRVTPEVLIVLGAAGGIVRWTAMGFAPLGWVLWPLQALHALSFAAAHVGAMRLLFREAPIQAAAMAQALYAALSAGLLMGAATLLSGALYDSVGARGYWAMALLALAGAALGLTLVNLKPRPQTRPSS
jgi:PPP family 3-phenylpropionic acid transporter